MPRRIYITGLGIISSIGKNLQETFSSLMQGNSGIRHPEHLGTTLRSEILVGEVNASLEELFALAGLPVQEGFSRNALLGIIAAKEATSSTSFKIDPALRTGLISATTVGGMDRCELYYNDFFTNDSKNIYLEVYDCADSTEKIANLLGIRNFITTISTACSSSANAILLGARLIRSGRLDRVLAGGCESLTRFHLNGFNSLKILDKEPCKPFDDRRNGINLGEGGAYIMLESEESILRTDNRILCEIIGWGNACEAYHQTASSPDGTGAYLAMKKALEMSGLKTEEINYINAHGTGTDNNDLSEGRAIEQLFGSKIPPVSSTKPFTGHTTSAAGATEAIISILALMHQVIWPNLNFRVPMKELSLIPVDRLLTGQLIRNVLSNSFGFGGNDTSLIFAKPMDGNLPGYPQTNPIQKNG